MVEAVKKYRLVFCFVFAVLTLVFIFSFLNYKNKNPIVVYQEEEKITELVYAEVKEEIKLLFVGDIMLSRAIGGIMEREDDWGYHFLLIQDFLNDADILFGNLESPISDKGDDLGGLYSFRADPRSIDGLVSAGFDVLSFANNHVWDYGREAFLDTLNRLDLAGIKYVGAGKNHTEAHEPEIFEVGDVNIAFLAYTNLVPPFLLLESSEPAVASLSKDLISMDIGNIEEGGRADFIVVSFHWGEEYQTVPNSFQKKLGRFTIDAGADLVIGHHPHVIQPVEEYGGGLIAYSLGNFIFDQNFDELTSKGLIMEVNLKEGEIVSWQAHEIGFRPDYRPFLIGEEDIL